MFGKVCGVQCKGAPPSEYVLGNPFPQHSLQRTEPWKPWNYMASTIQSGIWSAHLSITHVEYEVAKTKTNTASFCINMYYTKISYSWHSKITVTSVLLTRFYSTIYEWWPLWFEAEMTSTNSINLSLSWESCKLNVSNVNKGFHSLWR